MAVSFSSTWARPAPSRCSRASTSSTLTAARTSSYAACGCGAITRSGWSRSATGYSTTRTLSTPPRIDAAPMDQRQPVRGRADAGQAYDRLGEDTARGALQSDQGSTERQPHGAPCRVYRAEYVHYP